MTEPILSLENISKFYTSATNVVVGLNSINLSFRRGEFVAITGESGSGKSTLSNVLGGILPYESGEMQLGGKPTSHYDSSDWERYRRDNISYISQNYGILPGATVQMNVVSALLLSGMEKYQAQKDARQILEQVELWELRHRRAARLSSGQKQRLSIARALAKPAPILIADEPTGNLDPENSAKVIDLLCQAAKTRLVLLVTHEFTEVQDFATRHIRLQDGRVVMDTELRSASDAEPLPETVRHKKSMSLYVSRLQVTSRPVWSVLMTVFFALTAFAVFAFLGAFIIALDDTNTRIYDSSAFPNADPHRIVVSDSNLLPLDQEDYALLANMKHVTSLERNGYVSDVQYHYQDGVDYNTIQTEKVHTFPDGVVYHEILISYQMRSSAPFMRTVPVLPQGQTFLKEGRLPENCYEVVAHRSSGLDIGEAIKVFFTNDRYWGANVHLQLEYTVVGITDHGSGLYFHDDMGKYFQHIVHTAGNAQYYQFLPMLKPRTELFEGIPEESYPEDFSFFLQDNECSLHWSILTSKVSGFDPFEDSLTIQIPNINLIREGQDPLYWKNKVELTTPQIYTFTYEEDQQEITAKRVVCLPHNTQWLTRLVYVSQNTFDQLCWNEASEQVSLSITDYAYTDRVIQSLQEAGYIAVSPFKLGATKIDEEKAAQREQTLSICLMALLVTIALQIVLLRAMFSAQTESYLLLSNIGLVSKSAKRSVLWQLLCFTVAGQLLGGGGIWLCNELGVERIMDIVKYLPPAYMALLSAVHLTVTLIAALWVIRALGRQVYPSAGRFADLALDDEKEAAV